MDSDSSSDDDVVVVPHLMKWKGKEHGANNNNDVNISKMFNYRDKNGDSSSSMDFQNQNIQMKTKTFDMDSYDNVSMQTSLKQSKNQKLSSNSSGKQKEMKNTSEIINPDSDEEEPNVSMEFSQDSNFLRKNNTFPLGSSDAKFLEELGINFMDGLPSKSSIHAEKRLLPPINKIATKRNRILSDTGVNVDSPPVSFLPCIQGSPVKSQEVNDEDDKDSRIKFQMGDDDLSDQETFDTSTSSAHDETSSSSDEKEMFKDELMCNNGISEKLQTKLYRALRLEELRSSPTQSIHSAPLFAEGHSLSDEEDTQSVCSDSQVIRSLSASRKKHYHSNRDLPDAQSLIARPENATYMADLQEDEVLKPKTSLGDEMKDYEQDGVSETATTQLGGILPAIPSHGVRERNFLVGNLTKHGSLLGADELHRYFPDRMLKLFVGTWNMQRKGVPRNLNDFLLPMEDEYLQDMYVIGVQESTQDQKKWEIRLQETLGPNHVLAHAVSHGVLHLSIFIRRDLIWFCSPFEEDRVTTRMVSQIKTKGAVAISFQFFGTSMIFVTSHFHSGESRVKERVEDYNRIKEKLKLPKTLPCNTHKCSPNDVTTRFDCTFWFGDLNFRVSQPHQIMHQEVMNPENYDFKEVLKGDQLTASKRRGRIFSGFTEPKIQFLPTYKFTPGTDLYDSSAKLRVPSYTDRILYKSRDPNMITCNRYDSITRLKKSDHRPVYGLFEVCLKPGRDSIPLGGGRFRRDVYEKAARLRAHGTYQTNSAVCAIL